MAHKAMQLTYHNSGFWYLSPCTRPSVGHWHGMVETRAWRFNALLPASTLW